MGFWKLEGKDIEQALKSETRQYLCGNLKLPQLLSHFETSDIEIGISDYQNFAHEDAHYHTIAHEFQYVIKGLTEYVDISNDKTMRFGTGDFYVISPNTSYIQRVKQSTRILFVKFPAGNDKISVEVEDALATWASQKLIVERLDLDGSDTPKPNSMVPAATAALIDSKKRILLLQRRDSGNWTMPGGTMELEESIEECVVREIREETSIDAEVVSIIGTYTDPNTIIAYSDGEIRREFSILFHARPSTTVTEIDD